MLKFVSRKIALQQCPQLGKQLMGYQRAAFNPEEDIYVEGDEAFLGLDDTQPTILTKEQAAKLNIENKNYCTSLWDDFDDIPSQNSWVEHVVAELDAPSFNVFAEEIGHNILKLSQALKWGEVIVISDIKRPYLAQENSHEAVLQAAQKLLARGMTRTTTDGIILHDTHFADFFSSVFWIVRCNASAPGICFSSPNSNIVGTLCRYGNIHFDSYCDAESVLLRSALKASGFREVQNGICSENFSSSGNITGRELSA